LGLRPELKVEILVVGHASVVSLRGEMDIATASKVQSALDAARGDGALVLDLRAVEFIDTSGLRVLVSERRRAREEGYKFAVVRGSNQVQRLLEIAGFSPGDAMFVDDPAEVTGGSQG
jgi:anti-sigma B factor antagonist